MLPPLVLCSVPNYCSMGNRQAVPGSGRRRRPLRRQKSVEDSSYTPLLRLGRMGYEHLTETKLFRNLKMSQFFCFV